jgi:ABC-type uncharacterized transport system involved in gliding motility auxiliary subunit/ABC-type transport system involved in cytochrome c biogenesis permease component
MIGRGSVVIARRELKSFLDRPTGYVLLFVFAALVHFLFFRQVFTSGESSLRPLFQFLPWIYLVFVPAISMRLLAEEERTGTLEVLLTEPVSLADIIVGKLLGGWAVVALALATTVPIALGLATAGGLDWGATLAQYLAALLLGGALVAIGLFASSLTRNQVTASIGAAITGFVLMIIGFELVTLALPRRVAEVFNALSLLSRNDAMVRGAIDLRDVLYFASVIFVFCFAAYFVLVAKRSNRKTEPFQNFEVGAALLLAITVAVSVLAAPYGLKLDLTESGLYTLSPATVSILRSLPSNVTITLFSSRDLPPQIALTYRDVRDTLREYVQESGGRVQLVEKFPDVDKAAEVAAQSLGVQPVQFNVMKQQALSVSQGWLGIAIQSGTKHESIPFVQKTSDLEYQLTSLILKLRGGATRTVAFLGGHNDKASQLTAVKTELAKTYQVRDVGGVPGKPLDLAGVRVLILAGPQTALSSAEATALTAFLDRGGAALFMLPGYTINQQFLFAAPNPAGVLSGFLPKWGASVDTKLIYDLRSNEPVSFQSGQSQFTIPYPYWPRMKVVSATVLGNLDTVIMPWPSPVSALPTQAPPGTQAIPLLITSPQSGASAGQPSIAPDQQFKAPKNPTSLLGGLALIGPPGKARWRMIVFGDVDFATDKYVGQAPENLALALNSIDWLAQDQALATIRAKRSQPRQLVFASSGQQVLVTLGNQFGVPLLIAGIGVFHLVRRRRRARKGDLR